MSVFLTDLLLLVLLTLLNGIFAMSEIAGFFQKGEVAKPVG